MDTTQIDLVFQYALAFAGQLDDYYHRRLRPIHLLKYAYLADLAFARRHGGQTFTGITWKFHHFGPWSVEAYQRIDPALEAIRASNRTFESKFDDKDHKEWWWEGEDLELSDIRKCLPSDVVFSLQHEIKRFGGIDTYGLLHHVYSTEPMLNAAPEDILVFPIEPECDIDTALEQVKISDRQKKLKRERIAKAKESLRAKLDMMTDATSQETAYTKPVYDEVFFAGLSCLEEMVLSDLDEGSYVVEVDQTLWESGSRANNDLP